MESSSNRLHFNYENGGEPCRGAPKDRVSESRSVMTADDVEAELRLRRLPNDGPSWFELVERVARESGVLAADICGRSRFAMVSAARKRCWALIRAAGYSLTEIASAWGRDHTTVMAGIRLAMPVATSAPVLAKTIGLADTVAEAS